MAAPQRREPGARAIVSALHQHCRMLYMDLPLALLVIYGAFTTFSRYLEGAGCQSSAAWSIRLNSGSLAQLPVYVPEGFPCGRPAPHQAAWLLMHPSAAFLLSADPTHRCWMFVAAVLTPLIWLISFILVSAAPPSPTYADFGIRLRSAFFPLIRIVPKAMALAQLASQGPIHTIVRHYTQHNLAVALLHVIFTAIGLLDLPAILALSLVELLLTLTIRYLLSMHGHATWAVAHVAANVFTSLGMPLLFAACVSGWERRSREQRRRPHEEGRGDSVGGDDSVRLAAAGAAAKVEGQVDAVPSQCSAGSSGEASGAGQLTQHHDEQQAQRRGHPVDRGAAAGGRAPGGGGGGGGGRTAALTGPSLLAAAAAAVAANNRARGSNIGGAVPFDDPEKWASVITARQLLAQPMAEWQPMFTRQRISIKVEPYSCSSANSSR